MLGTEVEEGTAGEPGLMEVAYCLSEGRVLVIGGLDMRSVVKRIANDFVR